ncbi:MAG: acyl carrier protein [Phototrophicales bacterium]|nr:MAG: acyl carrier protein [Phototrophicales bacterium]
MNEADVRQRLRDFILNEIIRDDLDIADDEGLITGGLMDSLSLVRVQVFIEEAFGVSIPDPQMTVAAMDTLDQMVARIMKG